MPETNSKDAKVIEIDEKVDASISSYDVNTLMTQTRLLASDYRSQTGNALPVTEELARFDAINLIGLTKVLDKEGVDAIDPVTNDLILVKGRVIFKGGKARQKLGKLSLQSDWQKLLMVIYNPRYEASQIYRINREIIESELDKLPVNKRGSMTVAKYKAIGELVWSNDSED